MAEIERRALIREVRQRLESLGRAGLDRVPAPPEPVRPTNPVIAVVEIESRIVKRAAPALPDPTLPPRETAPKERPPRSTIPSVAQAISLFGNTPSDTPLLSLQERQSAIESLRAEVAVCTFCPLLASTRTQTVFGEGSLTPRLMFVGEAPGADEDRTGRPFVGRAGLLLTDMITKGMGLTREEVYIANVLKSRPPDNRPPLPDEMAHCLPFLRRQIEILRPEFLCLLGRTAVTGLLETALPMGRLRGKWFRYKDIPTIVTYHPSYLLRMPSAKKEVWEDLQLLMAAMGLKVPDRRRE